MKEKAKKGYYEMKMKYASKNSKLTWQAVNDIVNVNAKHKNEVKNLESSKETLTSDPFEIAEIFNKFFCSIGNNTTRPTSSDNSFLSHIPRVKNSFFLKPFSEFDVKRFIKELISSKSVRPDDPPIKFIKIACEVIAPVLTKLFNLCMEKCCFPENLKEACVIPVFKKGSKTYSGNYRPISLTSPFSKLFEKCILHQLNCFVDKYKLLSSCQFGFQKNISTELAMTNIYESLVQNMDQGKICCSVFLDISKAFDSVNHQLLLTKLSLYGIRGPALLLLKSYLKNRTQYTVVGSTKSSTSPVLSGVPQGSVLGPFLFILFINDLPLITTLKTTLFADDACLSYAHDSPSHIESLVNKELEKVCKWMSNNKLNLNVEKTNFVLFQKRKDPIDISLIYNGDGLCRKKETKYLGIIVDEKLNFKSHISYCLNKLNRCLWAICKLRKYTTTKTLRIIYYSIAYPFLQYCISSWGGTSKSLLEPLFRKQKIIVRCILHKPYQAHSSPLFYQLNILKLEDIYKLQMGRLMQRHHKNKIVLSDSIASLSLLHSHGTRSQLSRNYFIPLVHTSLGKTSFSYNGPKIWNSFPQEVRNCSDFLFKQKLKSYLLSKYV